MKRSTIGLLSQICILLIMSHTALATKNGSYVGLQLGRGSLDYTAKNQGLAPATLDDDSGFGWRIHAGYQYNPNFAIEAGYTSYPDVDFSAIRGASSSKADIEQQSFDVVGRLIYPLNVVSSLYVKGGIAYVEAEKDLNTAAKATGVSFKDERKIRPTFGVGGTYEFYPNVVAELAWMKITSGGDIESSDLFSIGLSFYFG